nr:glutathione S-transferase T3-like [Lolium perenne]
MAGSSASSPAARHPFWLRRLPAGIKKGGGGVEDLQARATAKPGRASSTPVGSHGYFHGKKQIEKVNAWLFNSKDFVAGNCKTSTSFWGQIAATFNSTSDPARHRTSKQLKDHWNAYNKEVSLFNAFHIQESALLQSGADDDMVMKAAMERYANDKRVTQLLRRHHWWQAVRNEAKWKGQHGPGSGTDSTSKRSRLGLSGEYSSSDATGDTEEERPTGRDRAKAAARKGRRKGKETSSSSEVGSKSFTMRNMMKNLVKAKLFKQWNKM